MFYSMSELVTTLKENIGIADLPLPVTDQQIVDRIRRSSLREFSVRSPFIFDKVLPPETMIGNFQGMNKSIMLQIPKDVYQNTPILEVLHIDVGRSAAMQDFYYPQINFSSADTVIEMISEIQMMSALARYSSNAPTFQFIQPDKLLIYEGWSNASYVVTFACMHDISLTTMNPGQFSTFMRLAQLDLQWYLYGKLKRKENVDLGIGTISLKIDDWSQSGEQFRELLNTLDETADLDKSNITFF